MREVQSAGEDSVLDATGNSTGSGLDEASALRAQLAALNEKVKELEAKQAPQPPLTEGTSSTEANKDPEEAHNDDGVVLASTEGDQAVEAVANVAEPSAPAPVTENLSIDSDDDAIQGLEDVDGVLTQGEVRSPPPDEDVDQEEEDLIDLEDEVDYNALSDISDQEEFEEQEEEELEILEAEVQPAGRSSTPIHQDLDLSDSEDESVISVSDDGGADRMERMLEAAQEIQRMPPPAPRTSRDPRVLTSAARAASGKSKAPKSCVEKGHPPVPPANLRSPSSRICPSDDEAQSNPGPRAKVASKVGSDPVPTPSSPSLATGDAVPRDPEPVVQEQAAGPGDGSDRSSLFFIPERFKGLIRIEPTSSRMVQDEREWKLAEDHLLSVTTNEKGEKEWRFLKGFESDGVFYSLVLPYESLEERWVSGKRLVALQPSAREIPAAERAFASLKTPPRPSIYEAEARKLRKKRILTFADVENQNCAGAMGWSGISEDQGGVVVKELPIEIREILEGTRPARASSPPASFSFEGSKDSASEGFHKATYGDLGKSLNDYLE